MKKIAVISSSFDTNELYNPTEFLDKVDYHAFTDNPEVEDNWIRHHLPSFSVIDEFSERRRAKLPKILPHLLVPGYEYYIWLDSTNKLAVDPELIINRHLKNHDLACFLHTKRKCVYEEIKVCGQYQIETTQNLGGIAKFLLDRKFPANAGLIENTCRIQRNTDETRAMGLMWWELICKYSSRDQLSLPYVLYKLSIPVSVLPGHAQDDNLYMPMWRRGTHKRKRTK